jgi:hypothetical protein
MNGYEVDGVLIRLGQSYGGQVVNAASSGNARNASTLFSIFSRFFIF